MPPKASTKTTAPSKVHTVIIVLLMWVVALLVFGIGYLVYTNRQATVDTATDTTATVSCADEVAAAVAAKICPAPAVEKETYTDPFMPLTFQYPKGWHIYTFTEGGTGESKLFMDTSPISDCIECSGGMHGAIGVHATKLKAGETGKTAYAAKLAALTADTDMTVTTQSESATGGVIAWTDNSACDGVECTTGQHEMWFSSSQTYLLTAGLDDDKSAEREAAWTLFVSTVTTK